MAAILSPDAKQQFFSNAGLPAAGFKLFTYAANTTTPQATYANRAGTVVNTNPIILNARGEATVYLMPGVMYGYHFVSPDGSQIWTQEDVSADAGDASAVAFLQAGTGAVTRTSQDKMRDRVSARDYGVLADGVTNDTLGLQAAINYCAANEKELELPEGDMVVQAGLTIPAGGALYLRGSEAGTQGTRLVAKANAPVITVAAGQQATIENVGFIGESDPAKTFQMGVYLNNCQNVNIRHCTFDGLYDSIGLLNTVFYSQIVDSRFFTAVRSHIRGTGTSAPGYAIRVSGCQMSYGYLGGDTLYFENAGSLVFSDVGISPATGAGRCLRIVSNAAKSGIHQFDNCVFEGSALEACRIEGSTIAPIKYVYFSNCYFNQSGSGADAITLINVNNVSFVNSYVSGTGAGVTFAGACSHVRFVNADFPGFGTPAVFRALATAAVNHLDIFSAQYQGANKFMDLSLIPAESIAAIKIDGGYLGTNASPISLPSASAASQISVNSRGFTQTRNGGIASFNGGVSLFSIPHGLLGIPSRFGAVSNSLDAGNAEIREVTVDASFVYVQCKAGAVAGTNNVKWSWWAET
ncbi:hypothetical protein P6166_15095 [Stenotrophomonas sp. HITSZ_GD]|uniref:hypothetical protein n=1 Tax=Stenotrophomonas sp. HITSZ_GD TaxID=3037248 RepID=UPI00240E4120|nr:hypothetical protein [Stenotrophomonas sp. HITSZ_GD]MDG2526681.1 hypothetical protein [Stenotrophomonas sp. HITSZ_GD]